MNNFMIRIDLHNSTDEDYKSLDTDLKEFDILQTIEDVETDEKYYLPRGLYQYIGHISDREELHNKILKIVKNTWKDFGVVIIKSEGSYSSGLIPVKRL